MLRRRGAPIARIVAAINVAGFLMRAGLSSTEQTRRDAFHAARAHAIGLRRRELLARVR
jgi:hypothetical protein